MKQSNLREAKTGCEVKEVVADRGYNREQTLDALQNDSGVHTHLPEPSRYCDRTWADKSKRQEATYRRVIFLKIDTRLDALGNEINHKASLPKRYKRRSQCP